MTMVQDTAAKAKLNIYLAGRFVRQEDLKLLRKYLHATTLHRVTSRWLDIDQLEFEDGNWASYANACAERDLDDVKAADLLILDLPEPKVGKGGLYVELGYALALNKRVWIVGTRTNVFCHTTGVEYFPNWIEASKCLGNDFYEVINKIYQLEGKK